MPRNSLVTFVLAVCLSANALALNGQDNTERVAENTIAIVGPLVPALLDEASPGPYNQLYERIFNEAPFEQTFSIMPINRAHKMFLSGMADCLFLGANRPEYYAANGIPDMLISLNMNRLFLKAYTRIDEALIESDEALEGEVLAGEVGALQNLVDYSEKPNGAKLLPVPTNAQAFTMLRQRRINIVIAFTMDAEFYFSEHGDELFHASETFSVFENSEVIACHPNSKGQSVIDYVNPIIREALDSGEMARMLRLPS